MIAEVIKGDCSEVLADSDFPTFDLVYLDPPFFSQKRHHQTTRDGTKQYEFSDVWQSSDEYSSFLSQRLKLARDHMAESGVLFFHCDSYASHLARSLLDQIFGPDKFQSEIIWHYRRWSNSRKGLLPAHQTILFYSKSHDFKFNRTLVPYSETTNCDQILQKRVRDQRGKSVYARDVEGNIVVGDAKIGVPLGDVWDIPFLNPKAAERVGYPTQKPVLLLERIISLVTDPGDWVLDPFCGSGTTIVAASILGRNAIGIDINPEAVELARMRLLNPVRSNSKVLTNGRQQQEASHLKHLGGLDYVVVQRNRGIDAMLKIRIKDRPVFIRVQREGESLASAASAIKKSATAKGNPWLVLIQISELSSEPFDESSDILVVPSMFNAVNKALKLAEIS